MDIDLIAKTLKDCKPVFNGIESEYLAKLRQWKITVVKFAYEVSGADVDNFLEACGYKKID